MIRPQYALQLMVHCHERRVAVGHAPILPPPYTAMTILARPGKDDNEDY